MIEKSLYIAVVFFLLLMISITCYHCFLINMMVQTITDHGFILNKLLAEISYLEFVLKPLNWFFLPDFSTIWDDIHSSFEE